MSGIRRFVLSKKTLVIASVIIVMIVGLLVTWLLVNQKSDNTDGTNTISIQPEYQTALPSGKSIEELGGWSRISPPKTDPVYAYSDKIGPVGISVSEQLLPDAFKNDLDNQVAELAKKFNATTQIDASGTKAYIGTSAKGPQSAIFSQDGLLILIKSQENVSTANWIKYIQSLTLASKY